MAKSDYSYNIVGNVICIVDSDLGRMSVTNDIENVVREIAIKEKIEPVNYKVVYRDSEGVWDGYNVADDDFFFLEASSQEEAIELVSKQHT